jgi:hypothetical protein
MTTATTRPLVCCNSLHSIADDYCLRWHAVCVRRTGVCTAAGAGRGVFYIHRRLADCTRAIHGSQSHAQWRQRALICNCSCQTTAAVIDASALAAHACCCRRCSDSLILIVAASGVCTVLHCQLLYPQSRTLCSVPLTSPSRRRRRATCAAAAPLAPPSPDVRSCGA